METFNNCKCMCNLLFMAMRKVSSFSLSLSVYMANAIYIYKR